jgi:hypothetical protein
MLRVEQPGVRVELHLDSEQLTQYAAIVDYAKTRKIAKIAWIGPEGITVEPVTQ